MSVNLGFSHPMAWNAERRAKCVYSLSANDHLKDSLTLKALATVQRTIVNDKRCFLSTKGLEYEMCFSKYAFI